MAPPNILANTSTVARVLVSQQVTSTTETAVYTVAANQSVTIKSGVLCNVTGSPVTVSLSLVNSGGTADGTHRVISGYSLAAGDSLDLRGYVTGAVLGDGDIVSILVGTANAIDVVITGLVSS